MTFHEEQFPLSITDQGLLLCCLFWAMIHCGTGTDSVGVNKAQTSATDANEVLPTLEQPLSPTGGALSTNIDSY